MRTQYITASSLDKTTVINYYNNMSEQLNSLVRYLKASLVSLNDFDTDLSDYYSVDGSNVSNVDITSIKNDISERISYIEGTVLPAITNKIGVIKKEQLTENQKIEEAKKAEELKKKEESKKEEVEEDKPIETNSLPIRNRKNFLNNIRILK